MQEFKLPDLGEGMQEAEVVEWLVKAGDTLKLDQTMLKVETDKAVVEIPSPVAGRVAEIRVQDGQVAKVGDVLIVFESTTSANGGSSTPPKSFTSESANIHSASMPTPNFGITGPSYKAACSCCPCCTQTGFRTWGRS